MVSKNLEPLYTDYEEAGGATTIGKPVWGLDMSLGSYSTLSSMYKALSSIHIIGGKNKNKS